MLPTQPRLLLQALTLTMIAYATFAHPPQESLLTAVSEHALLSLPKFEQQAIANLIWALALLHALTPDMWNQLLAAFSDVDGQQGKHCCMQLCFVLACIVFACSAAAPYGTHLELCAALVVSAFLTCGARCSELVPTAKFQLCAMLVLLVLMCTWSSL